MCNAQREFYFAIYLKFYFSKWTSLAYIGQERNGKIRQFKGNLTLDSLDLEKDIFTHNLIEFFKGDNLRLDFQSACGAHSLEEFYKQKYFNYFLGY